MHRKLIASIAVGATAASIGVAMTASAGSGLTIADGDVMVSIGNGQVAEYTPSGTLVQTLDTGLGGFTTGSAFDSSGNFYVTDFSAGAVSEFTPEGALVGRFGTGYGTPESILFNQAGDALVGDLYAGTVGLNPDGSSLATYPTGRSDWIDLAADQCTVRITGEGDDIGTYNICTNSVGPDFATAMGGTAFQHRILSNGGELVADDGQVLRLDSSGNVVQTYLGGSSGLFALNLDPDGTSFWTASYATNQVEKVDIATGNVLENWNAPGNVFGLTVSGQITAGGVTTGTQDTTAPTTTDNVPTTWQTAPVTVTLSATDPDDSSGLKTYYTTGTSPETPTTSSSLYDPTAKPTLNNGEKISYFSVDPAGNAETVKTSTAAMVDTTAPTTTITLNPATPDGSSGWYNSAVGVSVGATDPDDSVAQTRCALDLSPAPSTFADLADASCGLTNIAADGSHTIYAGSEDSNSNIESPLASANVNIDTTPPSLAPTLSSTTVLLNETGVTATPHATDATSGVVTSTCGTVDTSTAGDQTVTCSATDNAGNTATATVHYTVQYQVLGFFSPAPGSKWKTGQTIPIKLALGDANGTRISDAAAAALVGSPCRLMFSATGAQTKTASCMKYDARAKQFIFNWVLAKSPTGTDYIAAMVTYPDVATTTAKSESITITK